MKSLTDHLSPAFDEAIVIMPLARVLCESLTHIGKLTVFPPGYLQIDRRNRAPLERKGLVQLQSAATGFSSEIFNHFAAVGFCARTSSQTLKYHDHDADITLLAQLSGLAERSFDLLRLNYCRLDLPDTLPGPVGVWDMSTPYMGALIYFPKEDAWCELAGASASYALIVAGIGLDLDVCYVPEPPSEKDGEVGAIAAHALTLLSDAMHARNDTAKFMRSMTLLEFLGSPNEYKQWKKLKGEIACHVARDKTEYLYCLEELRTFTSVENIDGNQEGYRTLVVHHGKFLEEVIFDRKERNYLFRRLQTYSHVVISDMMRNAHMRWHEFGEYRMKKMADLGVL